MWEQFFSPTNRYCEMLRHASQRQTDVNVKIDWFSEMELCVPPEDLWKSRQTVHDFYSFVQNHVVVWMGNHQAFITTMTASHDHQSQSQSEPTLDTYMYMYRHPEMHHMLTIGSRSSFSVFSSAYAPGMDACDLLLNLFAKSKVPSISLHCFNSRGTTTLPVSAHVLSHFMGQDTLVDLELCHVDLDDNFGRALSLRGTASGSSSSGSSSTNVFNLTLECCSVHSSACGGEALVSLLDGFQSISGALEVNDCWMDSRILAATLSGDNCRLKKLKLTTAPPNSSNSNSNSNGGGGSGQLRPIIRMDLIARSIQANKTGLVELVFGYMPICDRDLAVLCAALASHASVTTLDLSQALPAMAMATATATPMWPQESMTFWLQTIFRLIKANTVLQTVELPKQLMTMMTAEDVYRYQEETGPRLEMNRFRPHLAAIKAVPHTDFRAKLLARELTLHSVRHSPNLICMLISENAQLLASYRCCSHKRKRHRADVYD